MNAPGRIRICSRTERSGGGVSGCVGDRAGCCLAAVEDVPYSIAVGEMLPKLRRDATYLARNRMILFEGARRVDPTWTVERRAEVVAAATETTVALPDPIPLYVLYWTAWVDEDGSIHFRDDVYRYDAALERVVR